MSFLTGPIAIHDDHVSIVERTTNLYLLPWWKCMGTRRPIYELLNRMTWRRWGLNPVVWHLENLLLHAMACWLLYGLAGRLGWAHPVWIGAAFAAHPIQTHSWAYVTGRSGILAAIFLFLAARLYLTTVPWLAVAPAMLAMCCREDSLVFIAWLPLLEWCR